jgi:hypothetical protein
MPTINGCMCFSYFFHVLILFCFFPFLLKFSRFFKFLFLIAIYLFLCLQVIYMDFIDFNGNPGNIDYRLPRMSYIKTEDFEYLEVVDRNNRSRKGYGVLPVSICFDISFLKLPLLFLQSSFLVFFL